MKSKSPIIFIWIGKEIPSIAVKSLIFAKKNNSSRRVFLFLDQKQKNIPFLLFKDLKIEVLIIQRKKFEKEIIIDSGRLISPDNFWINTSLRFLYLKYIMENFKFQSFFHAELDNAVFNLDGLDTKFEKLGNGFFVPRDSQERAIASLLFCNRAKSLTELVQLYESDNHPKHDMEALGIYANKFPKYFFSLPTESYLTNKNHWDLVDPEYCGGLFDAASIGQFMLGVDPLHRIGFPSYNHFINENSHIDWNNVKFNSLNGELYIDLSSIGSRNLRLINLHIHAKKWTAFESLIENGRILRRLQRGKRSIVSGHRFLYIGWVYRLFFLFRKLIRKLLV